MTPHHILYVNAIATALCAIGMLATRGLLHPLFALDSPLLLDALAIGLLVYAGVVATATRRDAIDRPTLISFAIVDALWVAGSAVALVLFWNHPPVRDQARTTESSAGRPRASLTHSPRHGAPTSGVNLSTADLRGS